MLGSNGFNKGSMSYSLALTCFISDGYLEIEAGSLTLYTFMLLGTVFRVRTCYATMLYSYVVKYVVC